MVHPSFQGFGPSWPEVSAFRLFLCRGVCFPVGLCFMFLHGLQDRRLFLKLGGPFAGQRFDTVQAVRRPDDVLRQWIDGLKGAGITVMIVSNNRSGVRVTEFCGDLGIGYQGHAGKPSPKGLRAAMERTGADPAHTAMLGDKLLTDMLAAHRAGVRAWMVEPLGGPVGLWNHVLHLLQRPFKRACPYKCQKNPGENTK